MAHFKLDVTATGYVVHRITPEGSQLVERFDTDEPGTRKLLATLHQGLDSDGDVSGVVLSDGYDRDVTLKLRDTIDADEHAGRTLRALAVELSSYGERMPNA